MSSHRLFATSALALFLFACASEPTDRLAAPSDAPRVTRMAMEADPPPYNCETDNSAIAIIVPTIVPLLFEQVRPGDATLVLRTTAITTTAWFDAIAPYSARTIGVYSDVPRRPGVERTDCNRNTAMIHASRRVLDSLWPQYRDNWAGMLVAAGLDPADASMDLETAVGIGNYAGAAIVEARERDGMNQLGDANGERYNLRPYADTTGYAPVNTVTELHDPRRWQPDALTSLNGIFVEQQFVTPQLRETEPFSYSEPTLLARNPRRSYAVSIDGEPRRAYRAQADEVLDVSANLTDYQKMSAEFFDDKIASLGFSIVVYALQRELSLEEFVQLDFLVNIAAFDTAITVWDNKARFDAVRPFSAIRLLYGDEPLRAWGGPGQGTVDDITGAEWRPYLQSANHPEYPSATASFCRAHATAATLFTGSNEFGWDVPYAAGSSFVEPGVSPSADVTLSYPTWDDFSDECGISRLWAGVHFYDSIPAGQALGDAIGRRAYQWVDALIRGDERRADRLRSRPVRAPRH